MDRNVSNDTQDICNAESLSARRAWIEMWNACELETLDKVALRKESVDRNVGIVDDGIHHPWSLSARRAWIEMSPARRRK